MIYEYISLLLGMLKIIFYKVFNSSRIYFSYIPKINNSFKIAIKKNSKLILGKKFRARNNVSFRIYDEGIVKVGNNCFFNDNCSINCQQKITIGDNSIFGQNVMIFDHDHDYKNDINKFIRKEVNIGNNVWIGANCVILKGVTIGNNVVVAAGTIVREDIEDDCICYQEKRNVIKKIKL